MKFTEPFVRFSFKILAVYLLWLLETDWPAPLLRTEANFPQDRSPIYKMPEDKDQPVWRTITLFSETSSRVRNWQHKLDCTLYSLWPHNLGSGLSSSHCLGETCNMTLPLLAPCKVKIMRNATRLLLHEWDVNLAGHYSILKDVFLGSFSAHSQGANKFTIHLALVEITECCQNVSFCPFSDSSHSSVVNCRTLPCILGPCWQDVSQIRNVRSQQG